MGTKPFPKNSVQFNPKRHFFWLIFMSVELAPGLAQEEANTRIEDLKGITEQEVGRLKSNNILSLGGLWRDTGLHKYDFEQFERAARQIKIGGDRLLELLPERLLLLLTANALERASRLDFVSHPSINSSVLLRPNKKKFRGWFMRHLPDWVILLVVAVVFLLVLRAAGVLGRLPTPLGLSGKIVVTSHDLKSGDVLQSDRDLVMARALGGEKFFTRPDGLSGLILKKDVSRGKPLRPDALLRSQVVATRDIAAGEKIEKDAVTSSWSTYDPMAFLKLDDVVWRTAAVAIKKDSVISTELLIR